MRAASPRTSRWPPGRIAAREQRFPPESVDGDRRVIVLAGEPIGVVRRIAVPGEFRCNMAAGAKVMADSVTTKDREICARIAPDLRTHGLAFAGIDVIGDQLIEINVTSPTGVREIDAFSEERLSAQVIDWAERQVAQLPKPRGAG
jgi:glutathione synthase